MIDSATESLISAIGSSFEARARALGIECHHSPHMPIEQARKWWEAQLHFGRGPSPWVCRAMSEHGIVVGTASRPKVRGFLNDQRPFNLTAKRACYVFRDAGAEYSGIQTSDGEWCYFCTVHRDRFNIRSFRLRVVNCRTGLLCRHHDGRPFHHHTRERQALNAMHEIATQNPLRSS